MPSSNKKIDVLQKAIPRNPKYVNVEPTVDTGASITKYLKKIEDLNENFKIQPGEIFRRMKAATFVQLIIQVAQINGIDTNSNCDKSNGDIIDIENHDSSDLPISRSTLKSLVTGIGEYDMRNSENTDKLPENNIDVVDPIRTPYLLLDVRDKDEFDNCHIIQSLSYPSAMLCRSVNFETREMLNMRNKPGHIIVLYDEDMRIAPRVATTLTQRGYENIFVLSGGLKVAWKLFPKGLILGEPAKSLLNKPTKTKRLLNKIGLQRLSTAISNSNNDASSVQSSVRRSSRSVAKYAFYDAVGSRGKPNSQEKYTMTDLAHLSFFIDNLFSKGRLNTAARSINTIASNRSTFSKISQKPFK